MPNFRTTRVSEDGAPTRQRAAGCRYELLAALLVASLLCLPGLAQAQDPEEPAGVDNGNYHYQGSMEFGYRFVDTTGNNEVYRTFVDERQGPRLLDQTLNMRALNHQGLLFDNLYLSSFGWGGDAENATRLRISKNKWYNFNSTFRRDRNVWDYNSLANPLNPTNSIVQINNSPHEFFTTRRMYDYNLTLLPQSRVRFRLGYTRNNSEGPSFSSIHEGTDTMLLQNWSTVLNGYQAGVDIKLLPRTEHQLRPVPAVLPRKHQLERRQSELPVERWFAGRRRLDLQPWRQPALLELAHHHLRHQHHASHPEGHMQRVSRV